MESTRSLRTVGAFCGPRNRGECPSSKLWLGNSRFFCWIRNVIADLIAAPGSLKPQTLVKITARGEIRDNGTLTSWNRVSFSSWLDEPQIVAEGKVQVEKIAKRQSGQSG